MNLILVKREGMRRRMDGGAVYPGRKGQSEAEGDGRGQELCPRFRDTESRAQSSGGCWARGPVAGSAPVPSLFPGEPCPISVCTLPMQPVSKAHAEIQVSLHIPASVSGGLYALVPNVMLPQIHWFHFTGAN